MYIPKHFKENDEKIVEQFISANSFGILVTNDNGVPVATHIPFVPEKKENGDYILHAHIARANTQKQTLKDGVRVLVIFPGPHTYISSSWYKNTSVPTWNFISVHAYGILRLVNDDELYSALSKLVKMHEGEGGHTIGSYPEDYVRKLMKAVIGFDINVDEIQAKYKLSQNKNEDDRDGVFKGLGERKDSHSREILEEMKKRPPQWND